MNTECNKENRELCLTGLKGIGACIIAFIWHYWHFPMSNGAPMYNLMALFYTRGEYAVELFFILSGFGIMMGYGRRIADHEIRFSQYLLKRICKIYPLFFLTLLVVTVLETVYMTQVGETFVYPNFDVYHFLLNLFCIQDGILGTEWSFNAPSWCISVSFFCYIMFYYVAYKSGNKDNIYYCILVPALFGMWIVSGGISYPTLLNSLVARGLICFSIGVILYGIYEKRALFNCRLIGYIFLIIATGIIISWYIAGEAVLGNVQWVFILGIWPELILAALFIPWLNRLLQWKPLLFLGSLSLDIYLIHFPVQCGIRILDICCNLKLDYSSKKIWLLYVVLVIGVSLFYEKIVNVPYRTLLRKICLCVSASDKMKENAEGKM